VIFENFRARKQENLTLKSLGEFVDEQIAALQGYQAIIELSEDGFEKKLRTADLLGQAEIIQRLARFTIEAFEDKK
jgi:hypothetical protein